MLEYGSNTVIFFRIILVTNVLQYDLLAKQTFVQ